MSVLRLPFLWERIQHTQSGPLDAAELGRLDDVVNYATGKGLKIEIEPHDYGFGFGSLIGSAQTPNSSFADLWGKLAGHYKSNPDVIFGLMNEPHVQTATEWLGSANAAIAAIRSAGAMQEILVPGTDWDGAWSWTSADTNNATVIGPGVVDPGHNFAFEVHQYLDSDSSGTHPGVVSPTIGVERLTAITQWAEANHQRLFLGEVGVDQQPISLEALDKMLSYIKQHTDVWSGVTYWAGGPWWGPYMFSIEPQNVVTQTTTSTSRRWPFSWRAALIPRRHPFLRTPPRSRPEWRLTRTRGRHSATRSVAAQTRANSPSVLRRARSHLSRRRTLNCRPTLGGNNVYDVTVQVSDGHGGIDTQAIAVSVQNVVGASIHGTAGNDVIDRTHTVVGQPFPTSEEDILNGGAGSDTLAGGPGADTFVFDLTALTPAQPGSAIVDHILDYDQGNSGTFNPAEGDTFDFSALLSAGSGQPVGNLVRVLETPSGTAAILQIDQDGAANGAHWTTIAQLDGVHTGDGVKVIFDASQPAATLTVPALLSADTTNAFGTIVHTIEGAGGQIYALYDGLLGRDPDLLGYEGWMSASEHGASLHDIAAAFLASPEGVTHVGSPDNATFVEQLYETALHRPAESSGLQGWLSLLNHGASRADVALGIVLSSENVADMQPSLTAGVFAPDPDASNVARLYYGLLGRAPDANGLTGWTNLLKQGASLDSVVQGFMNSAEYQNSHAGMTDAQFIDSLYVNALGRHAEPSGLQGWMNALTGGTSQVAAGIVESLEAQQHHLSQIEAGWLLA